MFCFPPHPLTRLRLADGVRCRLEPGRGELVVGQTAVTVDDGPALRLLEALVSGAQAGAALEHGPAAEVALVQAGLAAVDFLAPSRGEVVASLCSSGHGCALRAGPPPGDWRLHPHAVLQPEGTGWRLSSPLSNYRLHLAHAGLLDGLCGRSVQDRHGLDALLARALWAAALAEGPGDDDGAVRAWSHEELLFHNASRRHADHRPRGKRSTRPAWAAPATVATASAPLAAPLRRRLQALSFESVLATRRSVRGPLPPPSLDELRDLLCVVHADRGPADTAPGRAYPQAGGVQALDFHLVTAAGADAPATLYGFDAANGRLQPVDTPEGGAQRLLDDAAPAWGDTHGTPCALVVVTARLPELAARYEATAYRLALLEAGCAALLLTQVATALGLGSCLLGNGDSALFAAVSGLPEWQSPAILEIAIAGRLAAQR